MILRTSIHRFLIGFFLLAACSLGNAQNETTLSKAAEPSAEEIVQKQLDAYNSKNLEAFMACFSDSVMVYNYPNYLRTQGKQEVRKMFSEFFKNAGDLNSEILSRIVTGTVVIDQEKVTGFSKEEDGAFYVTAIYSTENGLITEMRFIYP